MRLWCTCGWILKMRRSEIKGVFKKAKYYMISFFYETVRTSESTETESRLVFAEMGVGLAGEGVGRN